jgi:hypothetical protein
VKIIAWLFLCIFFSLLIAARLAFGVENPPGLPTPMHRVVVWAQPNPTNVGGYILRWGTNRIDLSGVNSTSAVIRLDPGQTTLLLQAAAANGAQPSAVTSNTVRMLKLTLESETNGIYVEETNWTWTIFPSGSKTFRTKMEWNR